MGLFDWFKASPDAPPTIELASLPQYVEAAAIQPQSIDTDWNGDKFEGSFGATELLEMDYWTLRQRSTQLFYKNMYAKGLIRRYNTNIINQGLHCEAEPETEWMGMEPEALDEWAENIETQFILWGESEAVDFRGSLNWNAMQEQVHLQALVEGDVLVLTRVKDSYTQIELVSGALVDTPLACNLRQGHRVDYGVETDAKGKEVAYWVRQEDDTFKRMAAFGRRTGRRMAKLVRGHRSLLGASRGEPLLGVVLQSLRELDRYRDAAQRKAALNAIIVAFIKKGEAKMGSKPLSGGAKRRDTVEVEDGDGGTRKRHFNSFSAGLMMEELQQGEEPVVHSTAGTDVNLGEFEASIIRAIAWANEMPPEILTLTFSSNYSASQAAILELRMFLNKARANFADEFIKPCVWTEWVLNEATAGRIQRSSDILMAYRSGDRYKWQAWIKSDWTGAIKPSTDPLKMAKGYQLMMNEGLISRDRAAREMTGTKFSKNAKKLLRENQMLVKAREPLNKELNDDLLEKTRRTAAVVADVVVTDAEYTAMYPDDEDEEGTA